MSDLRPGAKVVFVESITGRVVRAKILSKAFLVDAPLARQMCTELKFPCFPQQEGVNWARGWSTKSARALRAAVALRGGPPFVL